MKRKVETKLFDLWAIPAGETDRLYEQPMTSMPLTPAQVDKVKTAASNAGWHSFRIVPYTGEPPNFTKVFN